MRKVFKISILYLLIFLIFPYFFSVCFAETNEISWNFDDSSVSGFAANNSTLSVSGGNLVQTVDSTKNNTWLLSPSNLSIDTTIYKYLKVGLINNTTENGKFSLQTLKTNEAEFSKSWSSLGADIPNDGKYHEYIVDLSNITDWTGIISCFRLRLTAWTSTGTVKINYIEFSDKSGTSITLSTPNDPSDYALGESILLSSNTLGVSPLSVEYYANDAKIGSVTTSFYELDWKPSTIGSYYVYSKAVYSNFTNVSEKILINVYDSSIIEENACYWKFNGTVQGWNGNNSDLTADSNFLYQNISKNKVNSFIVSPAGLSIDAENYKYIKVRVKAEYGENVSGVLSIQWITTLDKTYDTSWATGTKTYQVGSKAITSDGLFHDYVIDLSDHDGWKETITQFRIKFTPWSNTIDMKVTIDYIRVSHTKENGISEEDIVKPTANVTFKSDTQLASLIVYNGAQYTDEIIEPLSDGTYNLPAGLYTYTATPTSQNRCKIHKNFYVFPIDVENGSKVISISHPEWQYPGYWQVGTLFLPPDEISNNFFADPNESLILSTPGFKEGRGLNSFTTQTEVEEFIASINSDLMWTTNIGKSNNDLNIPFVIFSKGATNNASWNTIEEAAEALHSLGKPIVWVGAQVHGNEISSGEGALQLIYELAGVWGNNVLDKVSVVVLPRINPKAAQYNRRTPNGSSDINRDRIKLELQETQALNKAYWLFTPEVCLDAHEYGAVPSLYKGNYTYCAYDVLISPATNGNVSKNITDKSRLLYLNTVHNTLNSYGLRSMDYYDGSLTHGITEMMNTPQTNANANGLWPSFSFLVETLIPGGGYNSMIHFERRVKSHLFTAKSIIEVTASNAEEVKSIIDTERKSLLEKASVYDNDDVIVLKQETTKEMVDFYYIDMENRALKTVNVGFNSYTNGTISKAISRPLGYLLPKTDDMSLAIERLKIMGVEVKELLPNEIPSTGIQKYIVKSNTVATTLNQGVYLNSLTVDVEDCDNVSFANGAYYIQMDQKMTNFIGIALEPEHESSFATYRVIDLEGYNVGEVLPYYRYIGDKKETIQLDTPVVTISSNGLASWNEVSNATGYIYKIDNGNEIITKELSVELSEGQKIVVKAISDNDEYSDSEYSEEKIYTVENPPVENPEVNDNPPVENLDNNDNTLIIIVFVLIGVLALGVGIFIVKKIFY